MTRLDWAILVHLLRDLSFSQWHLMGHASWLDFFCPSEVNSLLAQGWSLAHEEGGGPGGRWPARQWPWRWLCWGCGVRGEYGRGSSTGSPWNIGFFSFFLLSECLCHKYPTLALFVYVKACPWGRVCAIRSQEAVYGNWPRCPGVQRPPGVLLGQWAASGGHPMSEDGQSSSQKLWSFLGVILTP